MRVGDREGELGKFIQGEILRRRFFKKCECLLEELEEFWEKVEQREYQSEDREKMMKVFRNMLDYEQEAQETLKEMAEHSMEMTKEKKAMKAILEMVHPRKCYEEQYMMGDHRGSEKNTKFLLVRDGEVKEISIGLFFKLKYNELTRKLALDGKTFSSMQPPQFSSLIEKKWENEGDRALKMKRFLFVLEDAHGQFLLCSCLPMIVPNSSAEIDIVYTVGVEQESEPLLIYDQKSRAITHCNQQFIDTFGLEEVVVERMKKDCIYARELF